MSKAVLVVEDELITRHRLVKTLKGWSYEVTECADGEEAWEAFQQGSFQLVLTDWVMPKLTGVELCKRIREREGQYTYVILLTSKDQGLVEGMEAGADDFIAKPFNPDELRVRLQAGERLLRLEQDLANRVAELEAALARVERLEGLLPICSYCKNIRQEDNEWQSVERYVMQRTEASFSHSICPTCYTDKVIPMLEEAEADGPN